MSDISIWPICQSQTVGGLLEIDFNNTLLRTADDNIASNFNLYLPLICGCSIPNRRDTGSKSRSLLKIQTWLQNNFHPEILNMYTGPYSVYKTTNLPISSSPF